MLHLFTSESVSEGHPDKVADQISDAILDEFLAFDPTSKVACETLVTTGQVVVSGEVSSRTYVDIQEVTRRTINRIGYNRSELMFDGNSCGILSALHEQSPDINRGVDRDEPASQGAGDQGIMFGYATNETPLYIPLSLALSHSLLRTLADIRREGREMTYLRPDAKSQVTVQYDADGRLQRVHTIVVSTQHDPFVNADTHPHLSEAEQDALMADTIRHDIKTILLPRVVARLPKHLQHLIDDDVVLHVNPTGKFVIGGPHGDTGLTGRKIIVDTYGGYGAHGGGAFSGKDPSKVDRSAAYAARHIAKNLVAAGVADRVLVQLSYAIGLADPISVHIDTLGTSHLPISDAQLADKVTPLFDLTPHGIEQRLGLRAPIYLETASYGHMGREPRTVTKTFVSPTEGTVTRTVDLFTWERLDYVDAIRRAVGLDA